MARPESPRKEGIAKPGMKYNVFDAPLATEKHPCLTRAVSPRVAHGLLNSSKQAGTYTKPNKGKEVLE